MPNRKYYVMCDSGCKFESMTKEQILTAIMQAVNEGTIGDIDAGFVQTIKTVNGRQLKFFVGQQSEYEKLTDEEKKNLFALITNDTTREAFLATIEEIRRRLDLLETSVANLLAENRTLKSQVATISSAQSTLSSQVAKLTARVAALEENTDITLKVSYIDGNAKLTWNTISSATRYEVVIGGRDAGEIYYTTSTNYTVTPDMMSYSSNGQCFVTALDSNGDRIMTSNNIFLDTKNMAVCATVKVYNESRYSDIIVTYIDEEGNQDQAYVDKANSEISHNATIKAWKGAPFYIGDSYGGHETIAVYSSSYAYSTDSDGRYAFDIDGDGSIEIDVGAG